jgi:pimeloyl-ACP methyl ester carboxylesterase
LIFAGRPPDAGASPGAHVRLVADLPGSGEGRVSTGDFVQFVLRGLQTHAYVMVLGVDDAGGVHVYVPRAGAAAARYEPSAAAISLGASINLAAAGRRPGRVRLYALLSPAPLDEARVRAAASRLDRSRPGAPPLDLPVPQVTGVLAIEP